MAAGDVVSAMAGAGTDILFQPAAGVEVLITLTVSSNANGIQITNGALNSVARTDQNAGVMIANKQIFLNNTNYLRINSVAEVHAYTGVQIK